ncbi:unnamed protein product [Chrysoparadoxa australica]
MGVAEGRDRPSIEALLREEDEPPGDDEDERLASQRSGILGESFILLCTKFSRNEASVVLRSLAGRFEEVQDIPKIFESLKVHNKHPSKPGISCIIVDAGRETAKLFDHLKERAKDPILGKLPSIQVVLLMDEATKKFSTLPEGAHGALVEPLTHEGVRRCLSEMLRKQASIEQAYRDISEEVKAFDYPFFELEGFGFRKKQPTDGTAGPTTTGTTGGHDPASDVAAQGTSEKVQDKQKHEQSRSNLIDATRRPVLHTSFGAGANNPQSTAVDVSHLFRRRIPDLGSPRTATGLSKSCMEVTFQLVAGTVASTRGESCWKKEKSTRHVISGSEIIERHRQDKGLVDTLSQSDRNPMLDVKKNDLKKMAFPIKQQEEDETAVKARKPKGKATSHELSNKSVLKKFRDAAEKVSKTKLAKVPEGGGKEAPKKAKKPSHYAGATPLDGVFTVMLAGLAKKKLQTGLSQMRNQPKDHLRHDFVVLEPRCKGGSAASSHMKQGWLAQQRIDYKSALYHYNKALETEHENLMALFASGVINAYLGEFFAALTDMTSAIEICLNNPHIDNNGWVSY